MVLLPGVFKRMDKDQFRLVFYKLNNLFILV